MGYTLFLGDVSLDEYYSADIWPRAGGKAFIKALPPKHGGMIANAACVYAALGGNAVFMTPLNTGNTSKILVEGLKDSGVDPVFVIWDDSLADPRCIIFLSEDNNTCMIMETGLTEIRLSDEHYEALLGADYIYSTLSDVLRLRYKKLKGTEVLAEARRAGGKVFCDLDTGYIDQDSKENYREMDIAVFNDIGFDRYRAGRTETETSQELFSCGVELIVKTLGSEGCTVLLPGGGFHIPSYRVRVTDVTGAGDTFSAAFLFGIQHMELKEAAQFASAAAAICVQGIGARAGAVPKERVLDFMAKHA